MQGRAIMRCLFFALVAAFFAATPALAQSGRGGGSSSDEDSSSNSGRRNGNLPSPIVVNPIIPSNPVQVVPQPQPSPELTPPAALESTEAPTPASLTSDPAAVTATVPAELVTPSAALPPVFTVAIRQSVTTKSTAETASPTAEGTSQSQQAGSSNAVSSTMFVIIAVVVVFALIFVGLSLVWWRGRQRRRRSQNIFSSGSWKAKFDTWGRNDFGQPNSKALEAGAVSMAPVNFSNVENGNNLNAPSFGDLHRQLHNGGGVVFGVPSVPPTNQPANIQTNAYENVPPTPTFTVTPAPGSLSSYVDSAPSSFNSSDSTTTLMPPAPIQRRDTVQTVNSQVSVLSIEKIRGMAAATRASTFTFSAYYGNNTEPMPAELPAPPTPQMPSQLADDNFLKRKSTLATHMQTWSTQLDQSLQGNHNQYQNMPPVPPVPGSLP
ncbi:hypothetical protein HK102_008678 [Quaeritorhiza haematococci]|nr:hypothetical protein HK102_008678 [Quaeritorhiza haematococci]